MRVKLFRPPYQRNVKLLLAFAILIPAAGFLEAAGSNPISVSAAGILALVAAAVAVDAVRFIVLVTRQGIAIRRTLGSGLVWLSWTEIVRVAAVDAVLVLETRGRVIYQLQMTPRSAAFVARMVCRQIRTPR